MSIKSGWRSAVIFSVALAAHGIFCRGIAAKTIEVESEDEDVVVMPTPPPAKASAPVVPSAKTEAPATGEDDYAGASQKSVPRVRVDDQVGFYYFVKSGFVVPDSSKVSSIGRVIDSRDGQMAYSAPKRAYVELSSDKVPVKQGDLLVVYNTNDRVEEPRSGFSGLLVRNLAVVQVLEVQKNHCLVEAKTSLKPFKQGDRVKWNDDEIKRWKQARIKKALPASPIKCYVAGGDVTRNELSQTDFIILTAGAKKGVVEGQTFQLREPVEMGFLNEPLRTPQGTAKVFYVGPNYSMAQILTSRVPIHKGFEAFYQP